MELGCGDQNITDQNEVGKGGGGSIADVQKFQVKGGRKSLNEMMLDLCQI